MYSSTENEISPEQKEAIYSTPGVDYATFSRWTSRRSCQT